MTLKKLSLGASKMMKRSKPSQRSAKTHSNLVMTERQALRIQLGVFEGLPGDYTYPTDTAAQRGVARRALEERKVLRELGLLEPDAEL
jgi:hypothetical protein